MTRRDLPLIFRDKGRPWDLGKDVEESSVVSEIVPMPGVRRDLIFTGTPEGVGPVLPGNRIDGHVAGLGHIALTIGPAK